MKAVIQRVLRARVIVQDEIVGSIQNGLCVLVGIAKDDTDADLEFVARKILSLRLFEDEGTAWKMSVVDKNFEILCVSQFTLQARVNKGAKPDFHMAMNSANSQEVYNKFLELIKSKYKCDKIQDGKFGAYMKVDIQNDGPVTIVVESPEKQKVETQLGAF